MRNYIMAVTLLCCSISVAANTSIIHHPQIIAHRAGTADAPENTLPAIKKSLDNGADVIWITLQLSKDNIPVLYRPSDLKELTNKSGKVRDFTATELAKADAAKRYNHIHNTAFSAYVPTLKEVLVKYPENTFYLDIKAPDAEKISPEFIRALKNTLQENNGFQRTRVYSTEKIYLDEIDKVNKEESDNNRIQRFESRDDTRDILVNITMGHQCKLPTVNHGRGYGLEMKRDVEVVVVEKFTLGEGHSQTKTKLTWDKNAMDCFRSQGKAHIVFFGINGEEDYKQAKALGVDAVMVDSPKKFKKILNKKV
ncbi:glycerophosphodiester phosphodiesterase [Yersinia ruckeri]|uniref:glycerophosphodiester phosphodiesterase family protein n=1 Tax=Yersinia ruckeri TaxID=29486 RepID=UPI00223838B3|nr:glycerophosphodiester phosphodiesterase family protein [Yersinia ruckeri]MCW6639257.1 glycerophosphodiester phosphodiesterase [Yersinia ruckeri]